MGSPPRVRRVRGEEGPDDGLVRELGAMVLL